MWQAAFTCRNSLLFYPPPNQLGKITAVQHWNKNQNNLGESRGKLDIMQKYYFRHLRYEQLPQNAAFFSLSLLFHEALDGRTT